jgi:hypothetical protein
VEVRERIAVPLKAFVGISTPVLAVWGLIEIAEALSGWEIDLIEKRAALGVALAVALIVYIRFSSKNPVVRLIIFVMRNIWLWIFGNVSERRVLEDIHQTTSALAQSLLFGRMANLKSLKVNHYHIVYTHKGRDDHTFGDFQQYRIPGFPFDEAEIVILLWYFVASDLNLGWSDIRTVCSCTHRIDQARTRILQGPYSLVGSPKGNTYSKRLMEAILDLERRHLIERTYLYTMQVGTDDSCYLRDAMGNDLIPDATNPSNPDIDRPMKDYAMLMKLPNILADGKVDFDSTVLLFAGCKVAGQVALTQWIGDPGNLARLAQDHALHYFQMIMEVQYYFVPGGIPRIDMAHPIVIERVTIDSSAALPVRGMP